MILQDHALAEPALCDREQLREEPWLRRVVGRAEVRVQDALGDLECDFLDAPGLELVQVGLDRQTDDGVKDGQDRDFFGRERLDRVGREFGRQTFGRKVEPVAEEARKRDL